MRLGDAYKISDMLKEGLPKESIFERFRNTYTMNEIERFIPRKRRTRKDKGVKRKKPQVK